MSSDSPEYLGKKSFFAQLLTIYGRKPVLEALSTKGVDVFRLHLSDSNKQARILDEIIKLAEKNNAEIIYHSRDELSRISKNKKQDQGVAVDLKLRGFQDLDEFIEQTEESFELIALDNVTNPQNLGMMIRSVSASPITALLIPRKGCAKLDSLVIKASAGALFHARIIRCDNLAKSLDKLNKYCEANIIGLDVNAENSLKAVSQKTNKVFVLGNETEGLSSATQAACNSHVKIPMQRGVESLNVAITASLIAFRNVI